MGGMLAVILTVAVTASSAEASRGSDELLRESLGRVAAKRVLFGHQSVGGNVVEGLSRLTAAYPGSLQVVEVKRGDPLPAATFAHAFVPENGDPKSKLESFGALLDAARDNPPDLALVKFCWADIAATTDVADLFAAYRAKLAELVRRHPRTTFVHVTVPLTTVETGPKAYLKRLLGRPPYGFAENAKREEFNALLRGAFLRHAPVFDLARLEATSTMGVTTADWRGTSTLALAPDATFDGGHLTPPAQDRIARALIEYLASIP